MAKLPDNEQYTNRMEITGSSGRVYIVAQHKEKRYWCCSCPGWKSRRKCKHLTEMDLPNNCVPFELGNDFTKGYKQAPKPGKADDWKKEIEGIRPPEKPIEKVKRKFELEGE